MNKLEQLVYGVVSKNPALKQTVRNLYQGCFDLLPRPKEFFQGDYDFKEGFYFGFHDVDPISKDGKMCLANKLPFDLKMPKPGEGEIVGYFNLDGGKFGDFHNIGSAYAWNYHKGCRLQWVNDETVIHNTAIENKLRSRTYNVITGEERIINWPIDAISTDGKFATSFSYERLERCMPGYGYPYSDPDSYLSEDIPAETGLFLVDLNKNTRQLLVSLKQLSTFAGSKYEHDYLHFVTHSEFSYDNRYIAFLYRCIPRFDDYMKRYTLMCVYDRKESKLVLLPTQESGSHFVWNKKNQIIASVEIDGNCCHALYDMNDIDNFKIISGGKLNSDGHQSFINDNMFVTDIYPDRRRMARIYKADIINDNVVQLVCVYSPKEFQTKDFKCHIACDLHPRVSRTGDYLCFDSPRTGKRGLYIMKLNE